MVSPDRLAPRISRGSDVSPTSLRYCENTRPEQQLQAARAQHDSLRRSIPGDHVLHVTLLGVGGVVFIPHTLVPLKSLGLDL